MKNVQEKFKNKCTSPLIQNLYIGLVISPLTLRRASYSTLRFIYV